MNLTDRIVVKIAENDRVRSVILHDYKWWHYILMGVGIYFVINNIFSVSLFVMICITSLTSTLLFWLGVTFGLSEEQAMRFWNVSSYDGNLTDPYIVENLPIYISDITMAIASAGTHFGRGLFDFLTINFPVLLDFNLDLDWIHISLPAIGKSFFALFQFVIIFYIIRKLRRKIKKKINGYIDGDSDFFDKKFFGKALEA